jgi:hypothetical protein
MRLAEALSDWIPNVIQSVDVFYSSDDIRAGQRWNAEINAQLSETDFGVLCVTPENVGAPWLNFEAGALSKKLNDDTRVVPVTLGFDPSALDDPLKQFNGTRADVDGIRKLVRSVAEVANSPADVDKAFTLWWPELEGQIAQIPEPADDVALPEPPNPSEMIKEILGIVKGLAGRQHNDAADPPVPSEVLTRILQRIREQPVSTTSASKYFVDSLRQQDDPQRVEWMVERREAEQERAEWMAERREAEQERAERMAERREAEQERAERMAEQREAEQERAERMAEQREADEDRSE